MSIAVLALVGATFVAAGLVKGVIGMGLPTVSLAVLAATLGLHEAMALLLAPSFATNLWQGVRGGHLGALARRAWPFLLAATGTVWIGAAAIGRIDVSWLSALLGLLLVVYGALGLARLRPSIGASTERWLGPLAGVTNGVLTGMTGSFVVPGVMYLQALGLPRDMLIQAMGVLFTLSTVALGVSLGGHRLLDAELALVSTAAIVPAFLGMAIGQRVRVRLSEARFRTVFFASVAVIGAYIVVRAA